jgi:hypothetical protein
MISSGSPRIRDPRYVVFESYARDLVPGDPNDTADIFLRDRWTRATTLVGQANRGAAANNFSSGAVISADGLVIGYHSLASNLVPSDTNDAQDVFIHRIRRHTASDAEPSCDVLTAGCRSGRPYVDDHRPRGRDL